PDRAIFFRQSRVSAHAELHLIFSMLVTLNRLIRNPTVKEQARDLGLEDIISYGHIGYPVLQASDILLYKGLLVPVGEDQLPHLELTREIARRFNTLYTPVFPEPEPLLTPFARLPGLDGRRMSKSLGNVIYISDSPSEIRSKIRTAFTDPLKLRKGDPGRPEICLIFTYHQKFNPNSEVVSQIAHECRSGTLGCVDCKSRCAQSLISYLEPIHQRRATITSERVIEVLETGEEKARQIASQTMSEVYTAMGMR
ncbi:MAG: tryptophan--tRNA ligase, partial [bacterium]